MKKILYGLLVAPLLLTVSCKKESTTKNDGSLTENSFTIDGKTYVATQVFYDDFDNELKAQRITPTSGLNEVVSVSVTFSDSDLPTTGGTFKVVADPYSPGDDTDNNEVSVFASTFPYDYGTYVDNNLFYPVLTLTQNVTVTINSSNKVNVKFTNLSVKDASGKTTTISGNVTQP